MWNTNGRCSSNIIIGLNAIVWYSSRNYFGSCSHLLDAILCWIEYLFLGIWFFKDDDSHMHARNIFRSVLLPKVIIFSILR
jgi:hypothetical protein